MASMSAPVGVTTVNIDYVDGYNPTGKFWNSIQVFDDELLDQKGNRWSEGKKKWVDVETILKKLAVFEKPTYFVFCRTNPSLPDLNYPSRKSGDPYSIKTPIPYVEGNQYIYLETHGKYREDKFKELPGFYTDKTNFYFRAPPGKYCTQHGPVYGYIPYDYAMSCLIGGMEVVTTPTNDLLQLDGMNIMLRNYSTEYCNATFLTRSQTQGKRVITDGIAALGRQKATALGKRLSATNRYQAEVNAQLREHASQVKKAYQIKRELRLQKANEAMFKMYGSNQHTYTNYTDQDLNDIEEIFGPFEGNENKSTVSEGKPKKIKIGGSIRRMLRKRKTRKTRGR